LQWGLVVQQRNSGIDIRDHLPIVIVCDNGRQDADPAFAQVHRALDAARIDCIVLEGQGTSLTMIRGHAGIEDNKLADRCLTEFSVVVPILNEEDNLTELYRRLTKVMAELEESYELIFVNDGSRDGSLELLKELHRRDPCTRVISLARNFGHQQAISAGLDYARGRAVVVMDGDLQDPPEVILQFIDKWREGFQVVYAIREKRKEHVLKRMAYHSFYLVLRAISRVDIPLEAGDFCLMDRCVVDVLTSLPERNRFVRGLRSWVGFRQIGLAYERDARLAGKSKYTFRKLVSLALDGLVSFSYLPLRIATLLGFGVSALSLLAAAYYLSKRLTIGVGPPGFATQVVLISLLGGVQLITIGVIGEYIGRVLDEVKGRPTYVVREVIGHNPTKKTKSEIISNARFTHTDSR
jgi:glycosyltransferase involved in cell wall biosynthesis